MYHVFIDVFEKHRFADKPSSRVADKYSASNLPSVPHIMDIAVTVNKTGKKKILDSRDIKF